MPKKPKSPCSYPGCPNLCYGQYCDDHKTSENRKYDRYERNQTSATVYRSKRWQAVRKKYYEAHAGWDEELLRVEIEALQAEDFDVFLTGFDEAEISKLFDAGTEVKEDEFNVEEELENPTFSKQGDIWHLGKHRLICGDSTKKETYDALMNGAKAHLVITDPPYNVNYEGSAGKIKNDNMTGEKFYGGYV